MIAPGRTTLLNCGRGPTKNCVAEPVSSDQPATWDSSLDLVSQQKLEKSWVWFNW